jgi:hypothetical protein
MIFSLFQSNKPVSQQQSNTTQTAAAPTPTKQPEAVTRQTTNAPKQLETAKSLSKSNTPTNNDNKLSFRLSDKALYESIANYCSLNNATISKFITDAIKSHAKNLQLHQATVQNHPQQRVTVPIQNQPSPPPQQNDGRDKLMEQWLKEAGQDHQRYKTQYEQERKKVGGYIGDWIPQQPRRR